MNRKVREVNNPASIFYCSKINNRNDIKRCEICAKITIKTSERCH